MSSFSLNAVGAAVFAIRLNVTDLERGLQEAVKDFSSFSRSSSTSFNQVALASEKATRLLENNQKKIRDEVKKTDVSFSSMITSLGGYELLKNAFKSIWNSAINVGSQYAELSDQTGVSTESLSKWSLAAKNGGTDAQTMGDAVRALSNRIGSIGAEGLEAADALTKLNLSNSDALKDPETSLEAVVEALQKVSSSSERAALSSALFGESAQSISGVLKSGVGSFEAFNRKAEESGIIISGSVANSSYNAKKEIESLKQSVSSVAAVLGAEFLPTVSALAEKISYAAGGVLRFSEEHQTLSKVIMGATTAISALIVAQKTELFTTIALTKAKLTLIASNIKLRVTTLTLGGAIKSVTAFCTSWQFALGGVAVALGAALAAANMYFNSKTKAAELTHEMENLAEAAQKLRVSDLNKFTFLEDAASQGELANDTFNKAVEYINQLQQKYGDLGISVDETTKRINMATDAQDRFNAAAQADAKNNLDKQIREEEENYKKLQDEQNRKMNAYESFAGRLVSAPRNIGHFLAGDFVESTADKWSAEMEDVGNRIIEQQKKLNDLRKLRKKIEEGNKESIYGEEAAGAMQEAANANAAKIEELDGKLAAIENKSRRASQSRVENAIEDAKAEEQAYIDTLNARLNLEKAKAPAEQNAKLITTLEEKINSSNGRLDDAVGKIKADEYKTLAERIEETERNISGTTQSETKKRIAQIDKESEAYKKLLESALAVADTEEKRESIQSKLDSLEEDSKKRKEEAYSDAISKGPSEASLKIQEELANTIQSALKDGFINASEQASILLLSSKAEQQQKAEANEKAKNEYQKALQNLTAVTKAFVDAKNTGDSAQIAEAAEKYAAANDAVASAMQGMTEAQSNETAATNDVCDAVNHSFDDSTKELAGCITLSGADAINQALKSDITMEDGFSDVVWQTGVNSDWLNDISRKNNREIDLQDDIKGLLQLVVDKMGAKFA